MFTKNCGTRPLERSWSVRGNAVDAYAVAVIKDGTIVSHLPRRDFSPLYAVHKKRRSDPVSSNW